MLNFVYNTCIGSGSKMAKLKLSLQYFIAFMYNVLCFFGLKTLTYL